MWTLTPSAADVGLLTCNSLAVRPFMAIEFFSGLLPIPESVWSDIQDRPTSITLYIQQLFLVSILTRFDTFFIVNCTGYVESHR